MQSPSAKLLSPVIRQKLAEVRRMLRTYIGLDAVLVGCIWVMVVFWIAAAMDYLPVRAGANEMPREARLVLLSIAIAGMVGLLIWRGIYRLLARMPDTSMALLLERHYPQLRNRLSTSVQLLGQKVAPGIDEKIYDELVTTSHSRAINDAAGLKVLPLFNWNPLQWKAAMLMWLFLLTGAVGMLAPSWLGQWTSRFFVASDNPWPRQSRLEVSGLEIQIPTFTGQPAGIKRQLSFEDTSVRLTRGVQATLLVAADTTAPKVPEVCTIYYRGKDGLRGRANLRRVGAPDNDRQPFVLEGPPLDGLQDSLQFEIAGNDVRLRNYEIEVVDPAVVVTLDLACQYPEYLRDAASGRFSDEVLPFRTGMQLPEGTTITLQGKANKSLAAVEYVIRSQSAVISQALQVDNSAANNSTSASSSEDPIPASQGNGADTNNAAGSAVATAQGPDIKRIELNGDSFEIKLPPIDSPVVVEMRLWDKDDLPGDQILRYVIGMAPDIAPLVETKLAGIGSAVTSNAILPVTGKITDDHRLEEAWVSLGINESDPIKLPLNVAADGTIDYKIDLQSLADQGRLVARPEQTLGFVVNASDRYNLNGLNHVGSGEQVQLAVVTAEAMLLMLEKRELGLRSRLELIIDELGQMRQLLQRIEEGPFGVPSGSADLDETAWNEEFNSDRIVSAGFGRNSNTFDGRGESAERLFDLRQSSVLLLGNRMNSARVPATTFVGYMPKPQPPTDPVGGSPAAPGSTGDDSSATPSVDPEEAKKQLQRQFRLQILRTQQSGLQADKSAQELSGINAEVGQIREELVNNRLDSPDKRERLEDRVRKPIAAVLDGPFKDLQTRLQGLQKAVQTPLIGPKETAAAIQETNVILTRLEEVLQNMLDIESYNEVMDLVRGLLEEQEKLLEKTQTEQKSQILDLFK